MSTRRSRPGPPPRPPAPEPPLLYDDHLPVPEVIETDCERVWAEFLRLSEGPLAEADFPPTQPLPGAGPARRRR